MTESPPLDVCPACGGDSFSHQPAVDSWICDECSSVLDSHSHSQPESERQSPAAPTTSDEDSNREVDWESRIAIADTAEANLVDGLARTETIAETLSLSTERTLRAGELIAEAWQTNFMHGRSQERTIGAIIYAVSREADAALPPAQIAEAVQVDKASIKQMVQKVSQELELDIGPPTPEEFVGALTTALELPESTESRAKELLQEHDSTGGNPVGIAAAALYLTCDQAGIEVTLKDLASVTGLCKETIWRQKSALAES